LLSGRDRSCRRVRGLPQRDALLVTKDEDFHRFSVIYGAPPKVVWVRRGNCTTDDVAGLLRRHRADIERFVQQTDATFLELG
jgi:predicted nuclease of predicted toxin-antitoxin system